MNFGAVMLLILFILATLWSCVCGVSPDDLIRHYFELGYTNLLISCFLYAVHGIVVSVSTVKRSLRKQHLRRRGLHRNLRLVAERVLVSLSVTCVLKCYIAGIKAIWVNKSYCVFIIRLSSVLQGQPLVIVECT